MAAYVTDLGKATIDNGDFRRVLFTGSHIQLVLMMLGPGEDIGFETHAEHDEFLRVEQGEGTAVLDGRKHALTDGSAVVIPAGVEHNIHASRRMPLKFYTLYGPPEHARGAVQHTKVSAGGDGEY